MEVICKQKLSVLLN